MKPAERISLIRRAAAALRALLINAGIRGPYVLVGHSYGGWIVHLLARQERRATGQRRGAGRRTPNARVRRGILPTMGTHFWSSPAATWRLARFAVLALLTFLALWGFAGVWIAAVVGVVVATLLLIDEVFSRRTGAAGRGGASV